MKIRQPAVAGQFYPARPGELSSMVEVYLNEVESISGPAPKAVIAPHAGYIYSGPIAGTAYAHLARGNGTIRRVVLLGPTHWAHVSGLAGSSAEAFATPLGTIPIDDEWQQKALALPQVVLFDDAHVREHSLEVQLPFLQAIFKNFTLVPLVVGRASPADVAGVLKELWGGPETVIVISSDLSHYNDYATAARLDKETAESIEKLKPLREGQACGMRAINGLLHLAHELSLQIRTVDLRSSGDTAGPRDRVVGYGAFVISESGS